jgi:DNA-binding transcriptional MerR regulator
MPSMFKSEYDELKDLGLSPKEIKEAIQAKKDLEAKTATLESELNSTKTTLSTVENSFTETKKRLDSLEANTRQSVKKEERTFTSILDDEDKAFDERFADRAQPLAAATFAVGKNTAQMQARLSLEGRFMKTSGGQIRLTKLWDRWLPEIEDAASKSNSAELMNSKTWINIFDYIKGKHIEELMEKPDTFVEGVASSTDTTVKEGVKPEKLNDEENSIIAKMARESKNVTPERYQEMKKKMKFVSV